MRAFPSTVAVFSLMFIQTFAAGVAPGKAPDVEFLLGFLSGDYRLVGQKPDSGAAYVGRLTLRERGRAFEVTRVIAGATSRGTASIERSREGSAVLRMRFSLGGSYYEATYLWRSDLDNYPRLTGYVYRPQGQTESPGLEALFHIPPTPAK